MRHMSKALLAAFLSLAAGVGDTVKTAIAKQQRPSFEPRTRRRSKSSPGKGKRGYMLNGKRVFYRPAVPWVPSPQNGLHWEKGRLVPPARSTKRN